MRRFSVWILVIMLLGTGGCASKYGPQKTSVNYYPACYGPIADLRNNEHGIAAGTATGAVIGALGGALVGLLATGGKWQGAVVGGATGGVAGTMAGNIYARKQQEADDNRRLASYLQDLDGDISNLDLAGAAARTSLQCYDRQFNQLVAAIRARQIDRQSAAARYSEISSGREEAIAILGNAAQYGRNLDQQYEQAFMNEEQNLAKPAQQAAGKPNVAAKRKNLETARSRKQALAQRTRVIEQQKSEAQEASARQTREINEVMANLEDIRA